MDKDLWDPVLRPLPAFPSRPTILLPFFVRAKTWTMQALSYKREEKVVVGGIGGREALVSLFTVLLNSARSVCRCFLVFFLYTVWLFCLAPPPLFLF